MRVDLYRIARLAAARWEAEPWEVEPEDWQTDPDEWKKGTEHQSPGDRASHLFESVMGGIKKWNEFEKKKKQEWERVEAQLNKKMDDLGQLFNLLDELVKEIRKDYVDEANLLEIIYFEYEDNDELKTVLAGKEQIAREIMRKLKTLIARTQSWIEQTTMEAKEMGQETAARYVTGKAERFGIRMRDVENFLKEI